MTLFAAFDEYGNIWPTTIRRSESDAIAATCSEPSVGEVDPFTKGVCIGEFNFGGEFAFPPKVRDINWIAGWRAKKT